MGISPIGIAMIGIIIAFAVFLVSFIIIQMKRQRSMKNAMSDIFKKSYPNFTYNPEGGLTEEEYEDMKLLKIGSTFTATDNVVGTTNNGIQINYCEVKTTEETIGLDLKPKTKVLFNGGILSVKLNKSIKGQVLIHSKSLINTNGFDKSVMYINDTDDDNEYTWEEVETENIEFNSIFKTYSKDNEEAFYIITPDIMESIIEIHNKYRADINISIKNDILYLAVPGMDLFEPPVPSSNNKELMQKIEEATAKQAINEIVYLANLLNK